MFIKTREDLEFYDQMSLMSERVLENDHQMMIVIRKKDFKNWLGFEDEDLKRVKSFTYSAQSGRKYYITWRNDNTN